MIRTPRKYCFMESFYNDKFNEYSHYDYVYAIVNTSNKFHCHFDGPFFVNVECNCKCNKPNYGLKLLYVKYSTYINKTYMLA